MHETAKGLHKAGGVSVTAMREIEALCLPQVKEYSATKIKRIRLKTNTRQAVFAKYLNTSPSTIQKWEAGQKHPGGVSLKLLNLFDQKGIEILI